MIAHLSFKTDYSNTIQTLIEYRRLVHNASVDTFAAKISQFSPQATLEFHSLGLKLIPESISKHVYEVNSRSIFAPTVSNEEL